MTDIFTKLERRTKDVGLIINESKTKYFRVSTQRKVLTEAFP